MGARVFIGFFSNGGNHGACGRKAREPWERKQNIEERKERRKKKQVI